PVAKLIAKEIRPPVANPEAHPLRCTHPAQGSLKAVRALARVESFFEAALCDVVDEIHQRVLTFGPQLGELLCAFALDDGCARLRSGRGLRGRCLCCDDEHSQSGHRAWHEADYTKRMSSPAVVPPRPCAGVIDSTIHQPRSVVGHRRYVGYVIRSLLRPVA